MALNRTWALGGSCMVLFSLLAGSGFLMLFAYHPAPEFAYASIQRLGQEMIFGSLVRNIHYFSANLLAILIFLHMARVFFTGGYQGIRKGNWVIGLGILGSVFLSCFTGYLLPWDQTAYWAVTICINMFDYVPAGEILKGALLGGGNAISSRTLQLFSSLHTTFIPMGLTCLLFVHFWKIRQAKGIILPIQICDDKVQKRTRVLANPNLFLREAVAAAVLIAFVMVLAWAANAPLEAAANAGISPNPAKAPWYFSGFQELQLHFHPVFSVFIIPGMIFLFVFSFPFIKWDKDHPGTWFISSQARRAGIAAVVCGLATTPSLILLDEYFIDFKVLFPHINEILSTGMIPFSMALVLIFLFHIGIKKIYALSNAEAFQTTAVFLIISFLILMAATCIFRGQGMKLIFPGG